NPSTTNMYTLSLHDALPISRLKDGILAIELLRRPEMTYQDIMTILGEESPLTSDEQEQVEIEVKYEGYIKKSLQQVQKMKRMGRSEEHTSQLQSRFDLVCRL